MRLHQLQVVDHHEAEPLLLLQPTGLGPDLQQGDRRGVVDEQRRLCQRAEGITELAPVGVLEPSRAQAGGVDACFGGQQPVDDLELRHLQAEQQGRLLQPRRGEVADRQGEARLAHGRAGRQDEQVLRLESGGEPVEIVETRRQARDLGALLGECFDLLEGLVEQVPETLVLRGRGRLGDLIDQRLRAVHDRARVVGALVAQPGDGGTSVDQASQQGLLPHDTGVVGRVGRRRHGDGQVVQGSWAADLVESVATRQPVGDRDGVDGLALPVQGPDRLEDHPVGVAVEVLGLQRLDGVRCRAPRQQRRAQHGHLRVQGVGRDAVIAASRPTVGRRGDVRCWRLAG